MPVLFKDRTWVGGKADMLACCKTSPTRMCGARLEVRGALPRSAPSGPAPAQLNTRVWCVKAFCSATRVAASQWSQLRSGATIPSTPQPPAPPSRHTTYIWVVHFGQRDQDALALVICLVLGRGHVPLCQARPGHLVAFGRSLVPGRGGGMQAESARRVGIGGQECFMGSAAVHGSSHASASARGTRVVPGTAST